MEPVKGLLVGLYDDLADSAFKTKPMLRVSRTDSRGHFVIKGIAPGTYRAYALKDLDGNFRFTQKSEMMLSTIRLSNLAGNPIPELIPYGATRFISTLSCRFPIPISCPMTSRCWLLRRYRQTAI